MKAKAPVWVRQLVGWQHTITDQHLSALTAEILRSAEDENPDNLTWLQYKPDKTVKKGFYMLEASVDRQRIGHDLRVRCANGTEFHLLLGSKAVAKRIIHLDSPCATLDFAVAPATEGNPAIRLSLTRLTSRFACNRMRKKLVFASGAVSFGTDARAKNNPVLAKIRSLHKTALYARYQLLMESHVRPLSYDTWLDSRSTPGPTTAPDLSISAAGAAPSLAVVLLASRPDWSSLARSLASLPSGLAASTTVIANSVGPRDSRSGNLGCAELIDGAGNWDATDWRQACENRTEDYTLVIGEHVVLKPDAISMLVAAAVEHGASLVYSDHEIQGTPAPNRLSAAFKPNWNPELLLSGNYIGPVALFDREILDSTGGFAWSLGDSLLYDQLLKASVGVNAAHVWRISDVLYRQLAAEAQLGGFTHCSRDVIALDNLLAATGASAKIGAGRFPLRWAVEWQMPASEPSVDILIPTRNRVDLLAGVVESVIKKTSYQNYRITVLDNDSDDPETLAYLRSLATLTRVQVLRCPGEFNFSLINNQGAAQTGGDVLVLLNNDTEVFRSDWLHHLVVQAIRPEIGCVGAKLYYSNGLVQHAGVIVGLKGVAGHAHRFSSREDPGYCNRLQVAQDMSAVTAACLAVRRSVFNEVGGLDATNLKVAYNDVDFCLRVREAGYRNLWTPWAELYHHESVSRGSDDQGEKARRFKAEYAYMLARWNTAQWQDPAYNPNLTRDSEDFSLAA